MLRRAQAPPTTLSALLGRTVRGPAYGSHPTQHKVPVSSFGPCVSRRAPAPIAFHALLDRTSYGQRVRSADLPSDAAPRIPSCSRFAHDRVIAACRVTSAP